MVLGKINFKKSQSAGKNTPIEIFMSCEFIEHVKGGHFVSQASACDDNVYTICHDYKKVQPYTLPLN